MSLIFIVYITLLKCYNEPIEEWNNPALVLGIRKCDFSPMRLEDCHAKMEKKRI